jgi:5-carboxyvanillate decarboxylase
MIIPERNSNHLNRRQALKGLSSMGLLSGLAGQTSAQTTPISATDVTTPEQSVRKIATEEAFNIPEIAEAIVQVARKGGTNLDLALLKQIYDVPKDSPSVAKSAESQVANRDKAARSLLPRLLDLDAGRLADMDASRVDMHILSLAMPGVQIFDKDVAANLASLANDRLAEAISRHPSRFAGLASFAPQDPSGATKEMDRAITN